MTLRSTFFSTNELAVNERTDLGSNVPPYLGSTRYPEGQFRLLTLMLSEDAALEVAYRATNVIPYEKAARFPAYDERGVPRRNPRIKIDIGAVFFDGTRPSDEERESASYSIAYVQISGVPNSIRRVGQTAGLVAKIYYTNGRTAYGGSATGCEPVTWSSSAPGIVAIDKDFGNIVAKAAGQATITVTTTRTTAGGVPATASRVVRVESIPATYMNTVSQQYQNYFATYIQQLTEHDLSLSLVDASASAVKATSFQRNFKAVWPVTAATLVTDLHSSQPQFSPASTYRASNGLSASKSVAVDINFQNRNTGDMFPLTYSWNFSGDEMKALLGADLSSYGEDVKLAERVFSVLRIDYQTANRTYTVIGNGGVSATEAFQREALVVKKADANRGVHIELTAYLANVATTGSNDGPQFVKGSGTTRLLVVPDAADDGAITGAMWMAQKASSSSTGNNTNNGGSTNTNTNTNNGGSSSGEGGGGGGGCSVFGLGLLGAVVLFLKRR